MTPIVVEGLAPSIVSAVLTGALALAIVALPLGFAPFLRVRLAVLTAAQAGMAGTAAWVLWTLLDRGGLGGLDVGGWAGAVVHCADALGLVPLAIGPSSAALWLGAALAGLAALLTSLGPLLAARSAAPAALVLAATTTFALVASAERFAAIAAAFAATSLCGAGAIAALRPSRDAVAGLLRFGTVHRVGDIALCVAVFVLGRALDGIDAASLVEHAPALEPWTRFSNGALAGFAPREIWQATALLVVMAAGTRLLVVPLFFVARDALVPAGGLVGFVHGVTSLSCGLVLLFRCTALLSLAPEPLLLLAGVCAATVVAVAILAAAARDVRRIDLLLLVGFASLATVAVCGLDHAAALLSTLVLVLACVPLCATSAHVALHCGTADPRLLGALEPRIPRTHTMRLLATGALCGPVFSGAAVAVHASAAAWLAPWLGAAIALSIAVGAGMLAFAAFRTLHLTFTGKSARSDVGTPRDPPLVASIAGIAIGLLALGVGVALIPGGVMSWLPFDTTYTPPLGGFVVQDAAAEAVVRFHVLPPRQAPPIEAATHAAIVVALLVLGWAASLALFRGGPRAAWMALAARPPVARTLGFLSGIAGTDASTGEVGEGAIRLSRLIAVNLAPAILETVLRRLPALVTAAASTMVRVLSSGSAQRGALFVLTFTAVLLWWWAQP